MTVATDSRKVRRFRGGVYVANLMAALNRAAITARIKQAREESGLKQRELAELLQVHWRTVQNWESEKNPIVPWDRLDELAGACGVTKEWLLHGEARPDLAAQVDELRAEVQEILRLLRSANDEAPPRARR